MQKISNGHHDLALGVMADGEDLDTAEYQHAEPQELGFIEGVRWALGQENQEASQ